MRELRPVDGEYPGTLEERKEWCAKIGHAKIYLKLSLSEPGGPTAMRCWCGESDDAPKPKSKRKPQQKESRDV